MPRLRRCAAAFAVAKGRGRWSDARHEPGGSSATCRTGAAADCGEKEQKLLGNIVASAFQRHCQPYKEFVARLPEHAEDFKVLSGCDNVRPTSVREFIKGRNYALDDDARACRTTLAAFAAYMIDFHNCRVRPVGLFRKVLKLTHGSFNCELFDLFYRVMFEGLEIPEDFKNKQMIEDQ